MSASIIAKTEFKTALPKYHWIDYGPANDSPSPYKPGETLAQLVKK